MSASPPNIQIRPHPTKGRALHATSAHLAGTPIASFTPLLLLPSLSHLTSVCTHCLRPGTPRACSRCQAAYYCDGACQAAGWKAVHARECKVLRQLSPGKRAALPTPVRALLQVLLSDEIKGTVGGLEGHVEGRRGGEGWSNLEMMAMGACAIAGKGTAEGDVRRAIELLCKIQTNAFHRYDADLGQVGVFLEPTLAMANHSCIPNAMVQFIGRQAILRAETPIQKGQEIEISYTDYTHPLSKRREALAPYSFECHCPRCKDDLNVYQICATSPNINLNRLSLASDILKLQRHPAASSPDKQSTARACSDSAASLVTSGATPQSLQERRLALKSHYRRCKGLVTEGLWAVAPVPQVLAEISIYYAEDDNFTFALAVACHIATACDPYRYTAPFHPVRAKGMFMVAKLLSNTAAATAELSSSATTLASRANLDQKVQETLRDIDQVSLCQMLLILVLSCAPRGYEADWELSVEAGQMLQDIQQLPGREKEASLIDSWKREPTAEKSRAFFDYAVVQQVEALASLGRAALQADFGDGQSLSG